MKKEKYGQFWCEITLFMKIDSVWILLKNNLFLLKNIKFYVTYIFVVDNVNGNYWREQYMSSGNNLIYQLHFGENTILN